MDEPKKKKPYSKPQIFFESFATSTNIAGNCEEVANISQGLCAPYVASVNSNIFNKGISDCVIAVPPAQGYYRVPTGDILCYSRMGENYNVFNS